MRFHSVSMVGLSTVLLPLVASTRAVSGKQFIAFVTNPLEQRINQMRWTYAGLPQATGDAPAEVASSPSAGGPNAEQAELSQAKAYCVQNHSGMYDCDGYAKAVADHRRAYPNEYIADVDGRRIVPIHDLEGGINYHLDCTTCLNDQLLASWARQSVRTSFSAAVISKALTQPKVDVYADRVAKASFRQCTRGRTSKII